MALILARHTRPIGAEGLCYGVTDLAPGDELAADAARLAELSGIERIVTSPLARAARLAEAVAAATGLDLSTDARLTEMNFGAWEGRKWDAIPRAELDAWAADLLHARPHGGETVAEMAARTKAALADCDGALVITHMGVIKSALAETDHPDPWRAQLGFGQILRL